MFRFVELVPELLKSVGDELRVVNLLKDVVLPSQTIDRRPKGPGKRAVTFRLWKNEKAIMKRPA
jgi:hypothetical protein